MGKGNDPKLDGPHKEQVYKNAVGLAKQALDVVRNCLEAEQFLCDVYWEGSNHQVNSPALTRNFQKRGGQADFINEATNLLALTPNDAETYWRRGVMRVELARELNEKSGEHCTQAWDDLTKATQLKPTEGKYWIDRATMAWLEMVPGTDAGTVYRDATGKCSDVDVLINYAYWRMSQSDYSGADELIAKAIAAKSPKGYVVRAERDLMDKNRDKALDDFKQALALDPLFTDAYRMTAELRRMSNEPEAAATFLKEGLAKLKGAVTSIKSSDRAALRKNTEERLDLNYALAEIRLDQARTTPKLSDEVVKELDGILEEMKSLDSEHPATALVSGQIDYLQATHRTSLDSEKLKAAITSLKKAYEGHMEGLPGNVAADALANAEPVSGNRAEARKIINQRLALEENNAYFLVQVAELDIDDGFYGRAIKALNKVVQISDPSNPLYKVAKELLAGVLPLVRSTDVDIPQGSDVTAENAKLFLQQAQNAWRKDNREGAIKLVEKIHKKFPNDVNIAMQLVNYYANAGTDKSSQLKYDDQAQKLLNDLIVAAKDTTIEAGLKEMRQQLNIPDRKVRLANAYEKAMKLADQEKKPFDKAVQGRLRRTVQYK